LTLAAAPADTARFIRWTGGCVGTAPAPYCAVDLGQAVSVTAVFGPLTVPVRISASGRGIVACSPRCSKSFTAGSRLLLRAIPAKGWRFASWGGACKGTRVYCSPKTDFAVSVHANFKRQR
jgi:uncharacterized protein (DUF779 family)